MALLRPDPSHHYRFSCDSPLAARKAGVERKRPICQCHHPTDVLSEERQGISGIGQDARIVPSHLQSPPSESGGFAPVLLRMLTAAVQIEASAANRSQGESRSLMWISLDRLIEKLECASGLRTCRQVRRVSAYVKVVSSQVGCRTVGCAGGLGGL